VMTRTPGVPFWRPVDSERFEQVVRRIDGTTHVLVPAS
jgi:hypothetical protein